jgi:hypothetical protein
MLALWLLLLAAALLSACGEKGEPDPGAAAATPIVYVKTGGIAGISQEARITPQGDVTASLDGEPPHPVDVDPALVDRARAAVSDIRFDELEVPDGTPVPDGFSVELTYGTETVAGDEARLLALEPLRPALSSLDAILAAALATNEPKGSASSP